MTTTTTTVANLLIAFTMSLALLVPSGCATDSAAPDPHSVARVGDLGENDARIAALCAAACDVLVGPCSEAPVSTEDSLDDVDQRYVAAACRRDCAAGAFTDGELSCLASVSCNEPIDDCFE